LILANPDMGLGIILSFPIYIFIVLVLATLYRAKANSITKDKVLMKYFFLVAILIVIFGIYFYP